MEHFTVHIEIHKVGNEPTKPGTTTTCRCLPTQTCHHAKPELKRVDTQVMNVTARVDGGTMRDLDNAINKAIKHLECERPDGVGSDRFRGGLNE